MGSINMQDVMAAYAPVTQAFNIREGQELIRDEKFQDANTSFDRNIQAQALPIARMLNSNNEINMDQLKGAKSYQDPYAMWEDLQSRMPKGRSIDPVVFQEKYQAGKQLFDMNIANQLAQMDEAGYSGREKRNALKNNPELYDYALQNSLMSREYDWGGLGKTAAIGAVGIGGTIGAEALARNAMNRFTVKPSLELSKELRAKGFARKGTGGIKKLNDIQIRRELGIKKDQDLRKLKKDGTVDKRLKKKMGYSAESDKLVKDYNKKVNKRIKNSRPLQKALQGNRAATGKVLRNTGKFISSKPSLALRAAKLASKIPRFGGLIAAGIGGGALAHSAISKYLED